MGLVNQTIQASPELDNLLKSPIIKADRKFSILKAIFEGKIGTLTMAFLDLIVKKRREMHVANISRRFVQLYLENNGVEEAYLITAYPVDAGFRQSIVSLVESQSNQKVELQDSVDPSTIGGFILRFGNKQIDASVKTELELLRREFEKNLYIKDY